MKIVTASNGEKTLQISKKEWLDLGKKFSLIKKAQGKKISLPSNVRSIISEIAKEVVGQIGQVNTKVEEVDPANVVFIDRSQCADILMTKINGKRFNLIYVKADGSAREFNAQEGVVKYKIVENLSQERARLEGAMTVYDLNVAARISEAIKREMSRGRLQGAQIGEDALKEAGLRYSYRTIYPEKVELIKCGKVWIVNDPTIDKVIKVFNKAKGLPENQGVGEGRKPPDLPERAPKNTYVSPEDSKMPGSLSSDVPVYFGKKKKPSWQL